MGLIDLPRGLLGIKPARRRPGPDEGFSLVELGRRLGMTATDVRTVVPEHTRFTMRSALKE